METLIVILIVGAAAAYTGRNLYKKLKGESGCNCTKGSCDNGSGCCASPKNSNILK